MNGWMDEWMNRWMNEWMDECMNTWLIIINGGRLHWECVFFIVIYLFLVILRLVCLISFNLIETTKLSLTKHKKRFLTLSDIHSIALSLRLRYGAPDPGFFSAKNRTRNLDTTQYRLPTVTQDFCFIFCILS